eukprot:Sspe_Gene.103841::Locus_79700_Transcript_1_1_Confidence_1.000_Length_482::g.103841::m.103841
MQAWSLALRLASAPGDHPEAARKKAAFLVYCMVSTVCFAIGVVTQKEMGITAYALMVNLLLYLAASIGTAWLKTVHDPFVLVTMGSGVLGVILTDYATAAVVGAMRVWPLLVLIFDTLLIMGIPGPSQTVLLSVAVLWLTITAAE